MKLLIVIIERRITDLLLKILKRYIFGQLFWRKKKLKFNININFNKKLNKLATRISGCGNIIQQK